MLSEAIIFMYFMDIVIQTINMTIGEITKKDPKSFLKIYLNAIEKII